MKAAIDYGRIGDLGGKATTSPTPTTTTASVGQCWDDEGAEAVPVSVLVWAKASVNDAVTAAQGDDG
ncbi:unnamed protein product [Fusarium graminearum]|uniref:Chromosome 4, complete genome n=2 Tax=Gibberella zeae TaxID=5518 RepID=A0A098DNM7_GIBZE|nr:unnamed protein product [Fusarium graminearum]CAF3625676.1 unnamed protein product [Fusarium graminearum]CAG1972038.1 unnamed protein product [Fusarium graminearum]CAG1975373.1 unnamed protein product [Fusarium graminearum]CAG1995306.1 unnamed protein product [Fusarium graminearum]